MNCRHPKAIEIIVSHCKGKVNINVCSSLLICFVFMCCVWDRIMQFQFSLIAPHQMQLTSTPQHCYAVYVCNAQALFTFMRMSVRTKKANKMGAHNASRLRTTANSISKQKPHVPPAWNVRKQWHFNDLQFIGNRLDRLFQAEFR